MAYRTSGRGRSYSRGARGTGNRTGYAPSRRRRGYSASRGGSAGRAVTINLVTSPAGGIASAATAPLPIARRGPKF